MEDYKEPKEVMYNGAGYNGCPVADNILPGMSTRKVIRALSKQNFHFKGKCGGVTIINNIRPVVTFDKQPTTKPTAEEIVDDLSKEDGVPEIEYCKFCGCELNEDSIQGICMKCL